MSQMFQLKKKKKKKKKPPLVISPLFTLKKKKKKNFWNISGRSSFWQLKVLDLGGREPRKNFFKLGDMQRKD